MQTEELFPLDSICSSEVSPALTSQSLAAVKDWLETPLDSGFKCTESRLNVARELSSSKMSLAFSLQPTEKISQLFWEAYSAYRLEFLEAAGVALGLQKEPSTTLHGECLTLSFSESPSNAAVCSLLDVLEAPESVPSKYFLSQKACAGIIRRAAKRGKKLPDHLEIALHAVAFGGGMLKSQELLEEDQEPVVGPVTLNV